jgi:H+/Cl- antiporter ClcA
LATGWLKRLSPHDREILLACAAGAGLGAVYAVPVAGALFTLRIILSTWQPRAVGAALITSSLAVAVASVVTHDQRNLAWPSAESTFELTGQALILAPLTLALAGAGLVTGICSHWWPELPGNGRSILTVSLESGATGITLSAAAVILVLKPLLTALFLRAGGAGGMLTPSLATGAAAGSVLVLAVNSAFGAHLHAPAVSLAGAAGVLAITQGSPIWAAIFVWELAQPPFWLFMVFLVTAVGAHLLKKAL